MPNFNGKITTSAIFYNRGVPRLTRNFGALVTINYNMLKSIGRFNLRVGKPIYLLF